MAAKTKPSVAMVNLESTMFSEALIELKSAKLQQCVRYCTLHCTSLSLFIVSASEALRSKIHCVPKKVIP